MSRFIRFLPCWCLIVSLCVGAEMSSPAGNLLAACRSNNLQAVAKLLSQGADVNTADANGETPLFYAVAAKNPDMVEMLLERNALVDNPESCCHSPMVKAAQIGSVEILKLLAARGGDLHRRYQIGERENGTLLHIAVENNNLEIARYLLSEHVSIETRNSAARSPLMLAAEMGNLEVVKLLVENGAYLYPDRGYRGTLMDPEAFQLSPPIRRYLQEIEQQRRANGIEPGWAQFVIQSPLGSDINITGLAGWMPQNSNRSGKDKNGRTLLHYLAQATSERMDLFEELITAPAVEIDAIDIHGQTPLHLACKENALTRVHMLLDHGAAVDARDYTGNTPLLLLTRYHYNHHMQAKSELEIATLLLEKGADINAVNAFECTPLLYLGEAKMDKQLNLTRLLIDRGADLNRQDHEGNTFLHNAADIGTPAMMKIVIEAGADLSICNYYGHSIQDRARYDMQEKLDLIYQYKKDVTFTEAVYYSQAAIVDRLLQAGTDVNATSRSGATGLIIAAQRNNSAMVKKLLALGATIDACDSGGCTALHCAAEQGYDEVVRDLLANKADVTLRNRDGFRAIDLAAVKDRYRTIQLFKDVYPDIEPSKQPLPTAAKEQDALPAQLLNIKMTQNGLSEEELQTMILEQLAAMRNADPNLFKELPIALTQHSDPNFVRDQMLKEERSWRTESLLSQTSKPLHIAVIKGELEKVKQLLAGGAGENEIDDAGLLPLTYAVILENKPMAGLLLENGADIDALDSNASFWNTVGVVGGHTVGQEAGWGAIHYVAATCSEEMLDFLIQKRANLNLADKEWKKSAIFTAQDAERPEILAKLVKAGANLNHLDKNGDTIVHAMARRGKIEYLKLLLELGAPVDIKNPSGATPLMTAARMGEQDAMLFLIENGADIRALNASGGDLLCSSIAAPYTSETLRILLEYGLDANLKNSKGEPALFCLFNYGNEMKDLRKNVQLLLDAGLDINACDNDGNTALHYAVKYASAELAELMIARGMNADTPNKKGETPLQLMIKPYAPSRHSTELTRLLIENSTQLNSVDQYGRNAVHNAAILGWADAIALLAAKGLDVNNRDKAHDERTPLHAAAYEGHVEAVLALIEAGADVSALNNKQETPLFAAAYRGRAPIVQLLLNKQVDVNVQNNSQNTPLHLAIVSRHKETVQLLLNAGARTDIVGAGQLTAPQLARTVNSPEIAALFQ